MVYQRRRCIGNPRRFKNVGQDTLGYDIVYKLVGFSVCPEVKGKLYRISPPRGASIWALISIWSF